MNNKIYIIWIGWILMSAIARYYNEHWYQVLWSDSTDSELVQALVNEWIDIIIGADDSRIDNTFEKVIYTEAIPHTQMEIQKSNQLSIPMMTWPEAISKLSEDKKLIAIAGTHGKSTTTSLCSILLQNSDFWVNAIVWTLLKEFNNKNSYFSESEYFTVEACEYNRSFLNYSPYIWIITNIEIDHLDYYKDLEDYISAFKDFIDNIKTWWYLIINWEDENCKKLIWLRNDITYIEVYQNYFILNNQEVFFPEINMQIPWNHILFDAHLTYCLWQILWLESVNITKSLELYKWVWRRMEYIGQTKSGNILMSDYWHHPTEIKLTLQSIKEKYKDKTLLTVFQPHQYNRTIELLKWFKTSFIDTDILVIPNIYESRDSIKDKENMSTDILLDNIIHDKKYNVQWLEWVVKIIESYEVDNKSNSIILLLWAGDVDNLRYKIKTT